MSTSSQFSRETIQISSAESGVELEVWLYLPQGHGDGPFPVVVAGHGLSLIKSAGLQTFGERWAEAGWASLILDFRGFGGSGGPRNLCSVARQTEDYRSVIDWAKNGDRKELFRSDRIVLFGFALSGLNISELAVKADEVGIAGVMSHCPVLDGYAVGSSGPINVKFIALAALDYARSKLGLSPVYLTVAAKPGVSAISNTPSSYPGFVALYEQSDKPFSEMPNGIAGRVVFEIVSSRPDLAKLRCPMLVVVPEEDDLVPPEITLGLITKAGDKIQCVRVPGGHFGVMKGGVGFEPNVKAQQDFLRSLA